MEMVVAPSENCACVSELLDRILSLRKSQDDADDPAATSSLGKHAWARTFAEFFLVSAHCNKRNCCSQTDDILWYVPSTSSFGYGLLNNQMNSLKVYRRTSKKQPPPGSQSINWRETLYLNLLLHQIEYTLTCAICTRTSPQNLQILRKYTQKVYASPSKHRMDSKGDGEQITYPNICFLVDNFEQVFKEIVVRDGECVCVELVARDVTGGSASTLFLGSVRYDVLKQVYDSKVCSKWRWTHAWIKPTGHKRLEFVIIRGPRSKGFAEMAVARVPIEGYQTPVTSASGYDDMDILSAVRDYGRRRRSDTNLSKWSLYESYSRWAGSSTVKKSSSETDTCLQWPEVEANTLNDEIKDEEEALDHMWSMRGFSQAWHRLREKRRADCVPLNAHLTYLALPWSSIIEDFFNSRRRPLLTFDSCDEECLVP